LKIFINIFIFFCCFPYLDFLKLGTDTQPNAIFLAAVLALGTRAKNINGPLIILWSLFGLAFIFALGSSLEYFTTVKTLFNYLSPAILAFVAYNLYATYNYRISFRFFMGMISIYFFVGFMQYFVFHEFGTFMLNEARGILVHGRGVISLCTEPAFYGTICLFLMIFSLLNFNKKENMIAVPFLLFQLFFLSKSSTALAVLIAAIGVFVGIQVIKGKILFIVLFLVTAAAAAITYSRIKDNLEDTRAGQLLESFIEDPLLIAQADQSASVRLTSSFAPFISMKENYFMPQGFGRYPAFISDMYYQRKYRKLIVPFNLRYTEKIGGSMNVVLFHLGFLGLLFPLAIYLSFKDLLHRPEILFSYILFMILLFTQIQLMHSMIGLIIGVALFHSKHDATETNLV